ncbi:hypothetical protein [Synechococcus sp. HK01-R]|uniref:hypothetical protein n=1 Tax=Synechococcus sp. HK01-R TaxID=2751171 RepID=UPI001625C987|nr:hypothetical protein [Synechococcus sp. HK01-R]QNG26454.1 hypothetical protein H0O21_09310 [Synechococcus sp. HK01-R]
MADTLQRLLTPRHACLCLEIGAQARSWDCIQGELSALSEDGACVILDGEIGTLPSQQGHLSLEDAQGHFGESRAVQVLWHRHELGHSCLGLRFKTPSTRCNGNEET